MAEGWREEKQKKTNAVAVNGAETKPPEWWDPLPIIEEGEDYVHFCSRVRGMVTRRERDIHEKFRKHILDQYHANKLMDEAYSVMKDIALFEEREG